MARIGEDNRQWAQSAPNSPPTSANYRSHLQECHVHVPELGSRTAQFTPKCPIHLVFAPRSAQFMAQIRNLPPAHSPIHRPIHGPNPEFATGAQPNSVQPNSWPNGPIVTQTRSDRRLRPARTKVTSGCDTAEMRVPGQE